MVYVHWIFFALYVCIVVSAAVAVLMDNRQPAKTLAWLLVLIFLPVVGLVFYFFFGQNTRKERFISQQSMDQLTKRSMFNFAEQQNLVVPKEHDMLVKLFAMHNWALPFKDNEVEIFCCGYDFFHRLLRELGRATHHIHLETYIICDDPLGRLLTDVLIDKARQGVEVRFIYDDVGCWNVPNSFFERMRNAGIEVHAFMPVKFPAFTSKVNYRNHRKLCVIDGQRGFIGGMNMAMRYIKGRHGEGWRDTHLMVRGGAVYGIQRAFLVDWYFVDRTLISNRCYYPPITGINPNNCLLQIVTSSPVSPWPEMEQGYVRILLEARQYVYMQTPYFLPTDAVLFAMRTAALAGVDVRLIVPLRTDALFVDWASRSFVRESVAAGVKVYFYKECFIHSKLLVSDDSLSVCGSANIDFRSFDNNFESNAFIYDRTMALRMKSIFLHDQSLCMDYSQHIRLQHPTFVQRLCESLVRLFAPLM